MRRNKEKGGVLLVLLLLFIAILSTGIWWKVGHQVSYPTPVEACTERGIAYFKEIGSWPTLKSTGQSADMVAKAMCRNNNNAFAWIKP